MCLSKKTSTQRIRGGREDWPSHPDVANLLPVSDVNRYAIVRSIVHDQSHGEDKQAESKVIASGNLL